ncbi:Two-component response regulator SSK1p [Conoideocrella luteorostrata]|uniref:Two-component response regulator SSK1p n=1 Tax=Conoideocrella luteorostrata TaxID=1105319 RepID=A0AAJ0CNC1_9HYPO|nr:Two-component response regulator SSK1p [Conoideocrella luteorostrata]
MASDIASRIKAHFLRRRDSTTPSLTSSRSGLGESSVLTAPSQSSHEAPFLSHTQLTASQTSCERGEIPSPGAASDNNEKFASTGKKKERKKEKRLSLLHVTKHRSQGIATDGFDNKHPPHLNTLTAAEAPRAVYMGKAFGSTGPNVETPGEGSGKARGTHPLEGVGNIAEPRLSSLKPLLQDGKLSSPAPSLATNIDKDPPRRGPGQSRPSSRSHAQPPQSNRHPSAHLVPPPTQPTSSPTSSPALFHEKTANTNISHFLQSAAVRNSSGRFCDNSVATSEATATAISSASPTHSDDDLEVDTVFPSHHGHDLDQLAFAPNPAVLSASAASSAPGLASVATLEQKSERRQSLFASRQTSLIKTLLRSNQPPSVADGEPRHSIDANMVTRKIWVKRPQASATTITINEDDLVDDVRDMILRKYANSLGRTFDSPDLVIRLQPRDQEKERTLGPEEVMAQTLDTVYPGGQTVDEALLIDIPRRTPKASPRAPMAPATTTYYITDDGRPSEAGEGYFPPIVTLPSPHAAHSVPAVPAGTVPHSIAVIGTGHIPPIPSPGGTRRVHRERSERPRLSRTHTSSPTIIGSHNSAMQPVTLSSHGTQNIAPRLPHSRTHSSSSDRPSGLPTVMTTMPKSPGPEATPAGVGTPPPRSSSPRASSTRPRRSKKSSEYPNPANVLNGSVPPINVLIVEDNPINLKLLEAFVKRLKVRWQTAMNGRDAVKKWRAGGFHLVLMDIQLPVMNGLDATREIRRLERLNTIGVFSSAPDSGAGAEENELGEQDRLENVSLFKSPVIIVALTASSLQSDRHEALAAGCNDFLTKPVNFVWLERKVMEWGCMQALIDFDGWRKWKEAYSQQNEEREAVKNAQAAKAKSRKNRSSLGVEA